jgi:hypothetical protein
VLYKLIPKAAAVLEEFLKPYEETARELDRAKGKTETDAEKAKSE